MKAWLALALALLALILAIVALGSRPAHALECRTSKGAGSHWSWRQIDGRTCWYAGRAGMAKAALHWAVERPRARPVPVPEPPRPTLPPPIPAPLPPPSETTFDDKPVKLLTVKARPAVPREEGLDRAQFDARWGALSDPR